MNAQIKLAISTLFTALCGLGIVTGEPPLNLLLFIIWSVVVLIRVRRSRASSSREAAFATGVTHACLMGIIVAIAYLAPVKRIDAVLQRPVQLPSHTMTIAELSEYCRYNRKSLPLAISINEGGTTFEREITFSDNPMPLQQFIGEYEQQTGSSHRFAGCGNAYSILYGEAYNFGLHFRPPADSQCKRK